MSAEQTVSVVVPVKDGARYLEELLDAIAHQRVDDRVETLVIDSGSRDRSVEIARSFGARVIEIRAPDFGHGKTRNFAVEQAAGSRVAFLTQDATPATEDWLERLTAPLDAVTRVGLSFGPHLPRTETSPMIARELQEFFTGFSPNGGVRIDDAIDPADPGSGFFSNVNSCVLRECWDQVRFRDVPYAEDQAFARDAIAAGWKKAFIPGAPVFHAHDFSFLEFMRRYFDEYRGLRDTIGHVEPAAPAKVAATARSQVRGDLVFMRRQGYSLPRRIGWGLRAARHHGGRGLFAALGSRSERLPRALRAQLSLEQKGESDDVKGQAARRMRKVDARLDPYEYVRTGLEGDPAPLDEPSPHDAERSSLHIAWVIPPFKRGSGGHMTIFNILRELELRGHSCSIWVHDPADSMGRRAAVLQREILDDFAELRAGVFSGFDDWFGADAAFATGWQTAYPLTGLAGCKLKPYLVQDYEPDFYAVSAQRMWAERTYSMGYPCITASPWLTEILGERFGATADHFELGVDHSIYRPLGLAREQSTILFYARTATPRRATELGLLGLAELKRRREGVRIVMFGDDKPPRASFDYELAGVVDEQSLAELYNRATVGLVLSLTNYSRIPKEMMACGLPVVDLNHPSVESVFGAGGDLIEMAEPHPRSIADRVESLLDERERRERQAADARRFVEPMTWSTAAAQVEGHLRRWLGDRWLEGQSRSASVDFVRP